MDLAVFNNYDNIGIEIDDFNCGGFALGTFDWYIPAAFDEWKYEATEANYVPENIMLNTIAECILHDFPFLQRITHYTEVPYDAKVIGFRLELDCWDPEDMVIGDFHFIVRYNREWFHKMGPDPVEEFEGNVDDDWCYHYNSDTLWFVDPCNELLFNAKEVDGENDS